MKLLESILSQYRTFAGASVHSIPRRRFAALPSEAVSFHSRVCRQGSRVACEDYKLPGALPRGGAPTGSGARRRSCARPIWRHRPNRAVVAARKLSAGSAVDFGGWLEFGQCRGGRTHRSAVRSGRRKRCGNKPGKKRSRQDTTVYRECPRGDLILRLAFAGSLANAIDCQEAAARPGQVGPLPEASAGDDGFFDTKEFVKKPFAQVQWCLRERSSLIGST